MPLSSPDQESISISRPKKYELVEQEYAKLQQAIKQYGDNASELMTKQKSEFLSSYKTFLDSTVKPEFLDLREEIEQKETQIATDERLTRCERERDWFKKEALYRDKVVEKMTAEKKEMQSRIDGLEQDKKFLTKQLELKRRTDDIGSQEEDGTTK
mmetsp:Transcript_27072/g.54696  ORF Transcript_27072/g.54696 Transcript_27072/m.54696 type:complete len:156 (-) Transcript_27072:1281-1748(-)